MQITIVPASSSVGQATVRALLADASQPMVRGIYRNVEKAPDEFKQHPHFEAVPGDIGSGELSFGTSEAVLYVPPMVVDGSDIDEFATRAAFNVRDAINRAGTVKRLISQSALGSQFDSIGVLRINTITDNILRQAAPRTFIIRPCTFYSTWRPALEAAIQGSDTFESYISPRDWKIPMVSVQDIADYCKNILLDTAGVVRHDDVKIFGPQLYSSDDVRAAIETVVGRNIEVKSVERDDLSAWWAGQVSEKYVPEMVEFTICQLQGGIITVDYVYGKDTIRGTRGLQTDFNEWAQELRGEKTRSALEEP